MGNLHVPFFIHNLSLEDTFTFLSEKKNNCRKKRLLKAFTMKFEQTKLCKSLKVKVKIFILGVPHTKLFLKT